VLTVQLKECSSMPVACAAWCRLHCLANKWHTKTHPYKLKSFYAWYIWGKVIFPVICVEFRKKTHWFYQLPLLSFTVATPNCLCWGSSDPVHVPFAIEFSMFFGSRCCRTSCFYSTLSKIGVCPCIREILEPSGTVSLNTQCAITILNLDNKCMLVSATGL